MCGWTLPGSYIADIQYSTRDYLKLTNEVRDKWGTELNGHMAPSLVAARWEQNNGVMISLVRVLFF